MSNEMQSKSFEITVPLDGSWVYTSVAEGPANAPHGARGVILHNTGVFDVYVKLMEQNDSESLRDYGILIRAGQSISQEVREDLIHKIAVKFVTAQASTQPFIASCYDYQRDI